MNQQHVDDLRNKSNALISVLEVFLRMTTEFEQEEKVYEQKMKHIAEQNKQVEKNRTEVQEKEKLLIVREAQLNKISEEYIKKQEELLLKEGMLQKNKEKLALENNLFLKERKNLEIKRIDIEKLERREFEVTNREKIVEMNEKIYADKKEKQEFQQKQLDAQAKRIAAML